MSELNRVADSRTQKIARLESQKQSSSLQRQQARNFWTPSSRGKAADDLEFFGGGQQCDDSHSAMVSQPDDPLEAEARNLADRAVGHHGPTGKEDVADRSRETIASGPRTPGEPLGKDIGRRFEQQLGFDFAHVRLHTDERAAESAKQLNALAYSIGKHVVLGRNKFSATEPGRSWLLAHELTHVAQHAQGRGNRILHRQPELVPELDRKFRAAIEAGNAKEAAEVLNGFSPDDIEKRLSNRDGKTGPVLSRGQIATIYVGALENPKVGKDAEVANRTRATYLALNYENELVRGNLEGAADYLNGFNEHDIIVRLEKFGPHLDKLQALHDAAVKKVGPLSSAAIVSERFIARLKRDQQIRALNEKGELTLPTSTSPGGFITVGGGAAGQGTGIAWADREPLSPDTDWSKDPAYVDNNVDYCTYDLKVNRFEVVYSNKTSIDLDYDSIRGPAGRQPAPPAPVERGSFTPAPAAGVTPPSPAPPSSPPTPPPQAAVPKPEARATPAFGAGGIFFRAKSSGRIYPALLSKATIPAIYACAEETARREPEARARFLDALISVAVSGQQVASSAIRASKAATGASSDKPSKPSKEETPAPEEGSENGVAPESTMEGCFVSGTLVLTPHGTRAIESLRPGELVMTYDVSSNATADHELINSFVHVVPAVLDIDLGDTRITCSRPHPFWVPNAGWIRAEDLKCGTSLLANDGYAARITSIKERCGSFTVYNLQVAGPHTYRVSNIGALVHNKAARSMKYQLQKNKDLDWRGTGKTTRDAVEEAFRRTGVPREEFQVTKEGLTELGKTLPSEWKVTKGPYRGAEVSIDLGHPEQLRKGKLVLTGPDAPHVGWQGPGKQAASGHIILDDVDVNRPVR